MREQVSEEQLIQKMQRIDSTLQEILSKDMDGVVISTEMQDELRKLEKKNTDVLRKLQTGEFTIAIVGLEKAGKSTLGNALIDAIVLPEYTGRCTYKTTKIMAGNDDNAEVIFYSRENFNKKLQKMMRDVGYVDGPTDIDTASLESFERYWKTVENNQEDHPEKKLIFREHGGKTNLDIERILRGKEKIKSLLDQEPRKFSGKASWKTDDFRVFVTGFRSSMIKNGVVTQEPEPYAVEDIVIHSSTLPANMIVYDVPGFNSPTTVHREETQKMMIAADAIILVTNVGTTPNLDQTQLDMLRKVKDEDGVRLCDKLFVFGNQIDRADSKQKAQGNINITETEVASTYRLTTRKRVVCGSAKAYLQSKKLFSQDDAERGTSDINGKLLEWELENGIEKLRLEMDEYNKTERLAVLRNRSDKILEKIEKCMEDILDKYPDEVLEQTESDAGLALDTRAMMEDRFLEAAGDISKHHKENIEKEKPFSKQLKNNIEDIFPSMENYEEVLNKIEGRILDSTGGVYQAGLVNTMLRVDINQDFTKRIVREVESITGERQETILKELVQKFLASIGMSPNSSHKDKLEQKARALFERILKETGGEECDFNSLVQRFVNFLIEALILHPYGTNQRFQAIKDDFPEFLALAVYYSFPTNIFSGESEESTPVLPDNTEDQIRFFAQILAHEGINDIGNNDLSNVEALTKFFTNTPGIIRAIKSGSIQIQQMPLEKWGSMLSNSGIHESELPKDLQSELVELVYAAGWDHLGSTQKITKFGDCIERYCQRLTEQSKRKKTLMENLYEFNRKGIAAVPKDRDDIIRALDADIRILRHITVNAVIRSIGLERAFINVITKNINVIKDNVTDSKGRAMYDTWINANLPLVREDDYANIKLNNANRVICKSIVESIKKVLEKMDG